MGIDSDFSIPTEVKRFLPRVVPCFPLLGLTPSGLFMGLSSTIIYTSELIFCSSICVPSATRHNIHIYPYFLFAAIHHLKSSPTFSVRPCSSVGRVTVDLIRRSWVRFPICRLCFAVILRTQSSTDHLAKFFNHRLLPCLLARFARTEQLSFTLV